MKSLKPNRMHRRYVLALLGLLAFNSWISQQTANITESDLASVDTTTSTTALFGNNNSNLMSGCVSSDSCTVSVTAASGKTKATLQYNVSFAQTDVKEGTDRFGKKIPEGKALEVTIGVAGCLQCTTRFRPTATSNDVLLPDIANKILADAKEQVRLLELARVNEIAKKALDKAVARCEKRDDGTTENGILVGVKLDREERLDCMRDHLAELDDRDQAKYFESTMLPFLNQMLGSQTLADRTAARQTIAKLDVDNVSIRDSVNVLQSAVRVQDMVTAYAQNYGLNARNPQAQMAFQTLQAQIAQNPTFSQRRTALGQATAGYWRADLMNELQLAQVRPSAFGVATAATADGGADRVAQLADVIRGQDLQRQLTQMNYANDPRYGTRRLLPNGRPDPSVPRPNNNLVSSQPVWGDPCQTRGVAPTMNDTCTYAPTVNL